MSRFQPLLILFASLAPTASAEMIFKCVDEQGRYTYQATDCRHSDSRASIDTRYTNTGSLGIENAEAIEQIHAERKERERGAITKRERAIQRLVAENKRSEARCRALKEQLRVIYQKRRYQRVDRDEQDHLTRQMREACSP